MNKWTGTLALAFSLLAAAPAQFECSFNDLADGPIDGQQGWDVFDKVRDSSACSVVSEVGTTEKAADKALVVKATGQSIRCVTDDALRWPRKRTAFVDFDFRIVVPDEKRTENRPVMVLLLGNSVLGETARWEIRLEAVTNGQWRLSAALPDEASQSIPAEKFSFTSGESTILSDWMHCSVRVQKLKEVDSFASTVTLSDKAGNVVAELKCTDLNKDRLSKAMWNLSRLHAGFLASRELSGLACIDNFRFSSEP